MAAIVMAAPAMAQDRPRFCPNRPSLGETPCTTEPGHVQVELSATDWSIAKEPSSREDTIVFGDMQWRLGVTRSSEVQIAWSSIGVVRTRDDAGSVDWRHGTGDLTVGWRQNLRHPTGKGFSIAIQPEVEVPIGNGPLAEGTWGAGVVVPVNIDLRDHFALVVTNEVAARPDEDGEGRHFALIETVGLGYDISKRLKVAGEMQMERDRDPADRQTRLFAAGSAAWQVRSSLQLDILVGAGLNSPADDLRILAGGAVGF